MSGDTSAQLTTDLPPLLIRGKRLLPIVQGGMGVGVSAHKLAGAVAKEGAMGTLSSVDLRRHHEDLMEKTGKCDDKAMIDAANLEALDREVKAAFAIAAGNGMVAVNVMKALSEYTPYVRQACESGAQAIVVGAGLPLDLPDLTADFPDVALIPILSDARGVAVVLRKWMRKSRLPDAVVLEHPGYAGGHVGAGKLSDVQDPRFEFSTVLAACFKVFDELGLRRTQVPLIVAGGINSPERVRELMALGASGVQLGTAFAVTTEGDAHPNFKRVLAEAKQEDVVEFMSVAGLPARAVRTPWLEQYLRRLPGLEARAKKRKGCTLKFDCLEVCGLRDGISKIGQFCIDLHLSAALKGDVQRGLFFRGSSNLPFGAEIRSVRDLIAFMLTPRAECA